MRKIGISLAIFAAVVFAAGQLMAQGMHGKGKSEKMMMHKYDPKTVETVEGEVLSVETVRSNCCSDMHGALHISLKTGKETITVFGGSAWYIGKKMKIQKGDTITVTGSRITEDGRPAIVAKEIKKGSVTLQVRKDNGKPMWRGAGMEVESPVPY